jgi:hypothetical protein
LPLDVLKKPVESTFVAVEWNCRGDSAHYHLPTCAPPSTCSTSPVT